MPDRPLFLILAGPNGAGKSTAAASLLPSDVVFLNADEMAKSLPGYPSHRCGHSRRLANSYSQP